MTKEKRQKGETDDWNEEQHPKAYQTVPGIAACMYNDFPAMLYGICVGK